MRCSALLALPLCLCGGIASAETATPEAAAALTTTLQTYLGTTEGLVTVTPADDAYDVTIDFTPLAAMASAAMKSTLTPLEFSLADNGDGTWEMSQDQAIEIMLSVPDAEMSLKIGNLTASGSFDESLGAFTVMHSTATDIVMSNHQEHVDSPATETAYKLASVTYDSTAGAGAEGGVDSSGTYEATGLSETMTMPEMGMPITLTAESQSGMMDITGLRPDVLYKLLAFAVAHPDAAATAAQQDALKGILKDGLPLFAHLAGTGGMKTVKIDTPMGAVSLTDMSFEAEANGLVDDGLFREAFTLNGLSLPAGLVPDWAAQLVPTSLNLDFKASRFNLAAPAAILLETMDMLNPQANTPEQDQALLAALLPDGVVDLTLAPGTITAPLYVLTYEGAFSAGPASPMPTGKATVTATGLTAVEQALATAPPEMGGQIAPMLQMAEAMGKPGENGALVWELETTAEGGFLVNGQDMMGMGGN